MAALLNDVTGFHHDNPVCLHDRRQSVSDDQTRSPYHRAFKGLLHKLFILRVKSARRFVQKQDGCVTYKCTRNREPLALTS